MYPETPSPELSTGSLNRAAQVIAAFRNELERYGIGKADAQAVIVSPVGDAILRNELGLPLRDSAQPTVTP